MTRNFSLDFLKLLLAFLIIALHIFPVSGLKGIEGVISYEIANGITRIGVPTFFIVSGYFLRNKMQDKAYLLKYGKRIFLLFIVWQLLYLPDMIRFYSLGKFTSFEFFLKLVFGYWHLWYLVATVGGVYLLYVSRNFTVISKFVLALSFFLCGYLYQLLYKSQLLTDFLWAKNCYDYIGTTRNFVFMAFPFLLIGTLYDYWSTIGVKLKFLFFPFLLLLLVESYGYYLLKLGALDFYLSLLPVSVLLFCIAEKSKWQSRISINTTLSLGIYLCHPYAIRLVYEFLPQRTLGFIALKFFLISFLALAFWFLIERINRKWPYFF